MGEVIEISEHRPSLSGPAICIGCRNKWETVAPVGTTALECGKCNTMKGRFILAVSRGDHLHFRCHCGNDLFCITPVGQYCPNCGAWVVEP